MKYFLQLKIPSQSFFNTWYDIITKINDTNWISFALGIGSLVILFLVKMANQKYFKKIPIPGPVVSVGFFVTLEAVLDMHKEHNVAIVSTIPKGFPSPFAPALSLDEYGSMIESSIVQALVIYIFTISIAKKLSAVNNYKINTNQEMLAYGLANFAGGFFQTIPIGSSLARAAVVSSTGSKTPAHSFFAASVITITIFFLTSVLAKLPFSILASIILFALPKMMDFKEPIILYRLSSTDASFWFLSFLITTIFGVVPGILVCIGSSMAIVLKENSQPKATILGRLPGTTIYRNIERFSDAIEYPGIKIFRFDSNLSFVNKDYFVEKLQQAIDENDIKHNQKKRPRSRVDVEAGEKFQKPSRNPSFIHTVIMDATVIHSIDVSAVRMLKKVAEQLISQGRHIYFANLKGPVRDMLNKCNFQDVTSIDFYFLSTHDAVEYALQIIDLE